MIREASPGDEEVLRRLLESVDPSDYVLDHISEWLRKGGIYVYGEKEIVGMVRLTYSKDGKAHLGAMRVHPDFRRQGIATLLTEHCIRICGTDAVRLAIMDNEVSQAAARKQGFSHVATFTLLLKKVTHSPPVSYSIVGPEEALSLLRCSHSFIESHSFLSRCFTFYVPSTKTMDDLLLIVTNGHLAVVDFDVEEALLRTMQVAYVDYDPQLVKAILYETSKRDMEEIWAIIPKDQAAILLLHGFEPVEWGGTIRVFERIIQKGN